jgi:hypothetical protein
MILINKIWGTGEDRSTPWGSVSEQWYLSHFMEYNGFTESQLKNMLPAKILLLLIVQQYASDIQWIFIQHDGTLCFAFNYPRLWGNAGKQKVKIVHATDIELI